MQLYKRTRTHIFTLKCRRTSKLTSALWLMRNLAFINDAHMAMHAGCPAQGDVLRMLHIGQCTPSDRFRVMNTGHYK